MSETPKAYKQPKLKREPLDFDATIYDDDGDAVTVTARAKHLRWHQFFALDDALFGEVEAGVDPTGEREIKARRIKLKRVLLELGNLDPKEFPGGRLAAGVALDEFLDDDRNADLVYALWARLVEVLNNPRSKSTAADSGVSDGAAPEGDGASDGEAQVPGVSRDGAAAG
jgi:hypothetical protein